MELIQRTIRRALIGPVAVVAVLIGTSSECLPAASTEPMLRIETGGQHTAMIQRGAVDGAGRLLLTGSPDKTARLWDLRTGALRRVLRPAGTDGPQGRIHAVALSPDGRLAVVGGWARNNDNDLYFFDTESGEVVGRLDKIGSVITLVTFSPDGKRLAAHTNGAGVFVIDVASRTLVQRIREDLYEGYGLAFHPDGALFTSSYDGMVRRYDADLERTHEFESPEDLKPSGLVISPDGALLAVGHDQGMTITFHRAENLEQLTRLNLQEPGRGSLTHVAWSPDGRRFLGGGISGGSGARIHLWSFDGNAVTGTPRGLYGPTTTVTSLGFLPNGNVWYTSADPQWAVLSTSGTVQTSVGPAPADFRGAVTGLRISADSTEVSFPLQQTAPLGFFSLQERSLRVVESLPSEDATRLAAPRQDSTKFTITDWRNTTIPRLDGRFIRMRQHETSRCMVVTPDGESFVLGGSWSLRWITRGLEERWEVETPAIPWGVNMTPDGRLLVAAYADGTIRWHHPDDGRTLLNLFVHSDRQRWVLWTPLGHYDSSPGAEELIGWHVNRGYDNAADFFPASRFRDRFYRPDVIDQVLIVRDAEDALRVANLAANRRQTPTTIGNALPPVVTIVEPLDGAEVEELTTTVRFRVRTPEGAPVTRAWALVDGRPAEGARALGRPTTEGTSASDLSSLTVPLPSRDCEITVLAENPHGISVPASVRVRWKATPVAESTTPSPEETVELDLRPKIYGLVVGVSSYANPEFNLNYPAKDAMDFSRTIEALRGGLYRDVELRVLTDAEATRDNVVDGLEWLTQSTTSRDVAMLFVAGHGVNDANNVYYFLPYNADAERLLRTGVRVSDIRDTLASIAGKALFFIDTCHAGNVLGSGVRTRQVDINGLVNDLASAENGAVVFTASTGRQLSMESPEWKNGAFTKALVEGLSGRAAIRGRITVATLEFYISERVKELTSGRQTPVVRKPDTVPDFPIALVP